MIISENFKSFLVPKYNATNIKNIDGNSLTVCMDKTSIFGVKATRSCPTIAILWPKIFRII